LLELENNETSIPFCFPEQLRRVILNYVSRSVESSNF